MCNDSVTGNGSELLFSIKLNLPGNLTMDDVLFSAKFKAYTDKSALIEKENMQRVSENEYIALVPTYEVGIGKISYEISVTIPFEGGERCEIIKGETTETTY